MKIAIHQSNNSFSESWVMYCREKEIPFKIVNCYKNDIIRELDDCDGLMWHFHQANSKDFLFAKQLLYSLQMAGKKVFPDFNTCWHFDDKVGQKYLLEAIGAPLVPSYVFYEKTEALEWVSKTEFPKVFKLRRGAGSAHVQLVKDKAAAKKLIKKAFGKGFSQYDAKSNLKERWRKYQHNLLGLKSVLKGIVRLGYTTDFDRVAGKEKGYVYFQDFIPYNDHDIRVIVIDNKAFAIKRDVRKNDFRASGSGLLSFEKENFDDEMIRIALKLSNNLQSKSVAVDFVKKGKDFLIVEISYGFPAKNFTDGCTGYWDKDLNWHPGKFNEQEWMVESFWREISGRN